MKLIFLLPVMLSSLLHQTTVFLCFLSTQFINTAGHDFHKRISVDYLEMLATGTEKRILPLSEINTTLELPKNFDARRQWSKCTTIGQISNQGPCFSGWAFASTGIMSDRLCIKSSGRSKFVFSANNLLSCCKKCFVYVDAWAPNCTYTYANGYPHKALLYWISNGIVSGGPYRSGLGCQPYEINPCNKWNIIPPCKPKPKLPACKKTCIKNYNIPYKKDLHFGKSAYRVGNSVDQIQKEIYFRGPVIATFMPSNDIFCYKSGVYKSHRKCKGQVKDNHAVRIIGWGEEKGVPYWLVANSWGTEWGEHGFIKISRGKHNGCIEEDVSAGTPKL